MESLKKDTNPVREWEWKNGMLARLLGKRLSCESRVRIMLWGQKRNEGLLVEGKITQSEIVWKFMDQQVLPGGWRKRERGEKVIGERWTTVNFCCQQLVPCLRAIWTWFDLDSPHRLMLGRAGGMPSFLLDWRQKEWQNHRSLSVPRAFPHGTVKQLLT